PRAAFVRRPPNERRRRPARGPRRRELGRRQRRRRLPRSLRAAPHAWPLPTAPRAPRPSGRGRRGRPLGRARGCPVLAGAGSPPVELEFLVACEAVVRPVLSGDTLVDLVVGSDLRPVVVSSRLALRLEASRHLGLGKVLRVRVVVQDRAEVLGAHVGLGSTVRFVCGLGRLAAFARVLVVEIRSEVLRAHVGLGTAPFGGPWRVAVLVVEVRSEVLRALLRTALRRRLFWLRLLGEIGGWCPHPRRFLVALLVPFGRTVRSALLLLAVAAEPGARRERSGAHAGRGRA